MDLSSTSLERLVPDELRPEDVTGVDTLRLHVERYAFAVQHARPSRILDIACGVGYGTRMLGDRFRDGAEVVGVDLSEAAIAYAVKRYGDRHVRFVAADAMQFDDPRGFDTIVSLETVEHLPDPAGFVRRLLVMLRPGGALILSVPTTLSTDVNPHHLHDFTEKSLRRMVLSLDRSLEEVAALRQVQPYRLLPLLTRREARAKNLRRNLPLFYLKHPELSFHRLATTLQHGFSNHYLTVAWNATCAPGRPGSS